VFVTLLAVTLLLSIATCTAVVRLFQHPIDAILQRIVSPDLSHAWRRYLGFAVYVVGVSGGVRIWELEKYITGRGEAGQPIALNSDRWVLEVYRTLIESLQAMAWLLLVFFVFALVAYVIVRGFELRRGGPGASA
jgi:hypothetical protein